MIPVPVLVLVSIVGLGAYAAIGGVVAGITAKAFGFKNGTYSNAAPYLFAATLWPAWILVVGVAAMFWVPIKFASRIATYLHPELPRVEDSI